MKNYSAIHIFDDALEVLGAKFPSANEIMENDVEWTIFHNTDDW